jgi:signal transduction histidine kinase
MSNPCPLHKKRSPALQPGSGCNGGEPDNSIILIKVSDTGLGIRPEDMKKLFKDFGRVTNEQDLLLNKNGVGLGLNLSNKLA